MYRMMVVIPYRNHLSTLLPTAGKNLENIDIIQACHDLRNSVQSLNDRFKGPLDSKNAKNTMFPFVFLLGNHSSGKSSFINYMLGRKVQVAGVAPTDDNFTIIAPGKDDQDRDGPALIGMHS